MCAVCPTPYIPEWHYTSICVCIQLPESPLIDVISVYTSAYGFCGGGAPEPRKPLMIASKVSCYALVSLRVEPSSRFIKGFGCKRHTENVMVFSQWKLQFKILVCEISSLSLSVSSICLGVQQQTLGTLTSVDLGHPMCSSPALRCRCCPASGPPAAYGRTDRRAMWTEARTYTYFIHR